jgi:hypothetical protein
METDEMAKPSKEIMEFMAQHAIDSDEIWEVHGNSWCIKHKALERAGAVAGIIWDQAPYVIESNSEKGIVAVCVTGRLKDRVEWSIGEAAPKNNKNAYPYAMAEKRAKDRVILKLLNTHGYLYSEAEFEAEAVKGSTLPKKDAKGIYEKMQDEIRSSTSREHLKVWMEANKDRILVMPEDWQDILRLQCEEMLADLRQQETV